MRFGVYSWLSDRIRHRFAGAFVAKQKNGLPRYGAGFNQIGHHPQGLTVGRGIGRSAEGRHQTPQSSASELHVFAAHLAPNPIIAGVSVAAVVQTWSLVALRPWRLRDGKGAE
jgi:hypothetical protein